MCRILISMYSRATGGREENGREETSRAVEEHQGGRGAPSGLSKINLELRVLAADPLRSCRPLSQNSRVRDPGTYRPRHCAGGAVDQCFHFGYLNNVLFVFPLALKTGQIS